MRLSYLPVAQACSRPRERMSLSTWRGARPAPLAQETLELQRPPSLLHRRSPAAIPARNRGRSNFGASGTQLSNRRRTKENAPDRRAGGFNLDAPRRFGLIGHRIPRAHIDARPRLSHNKLAKTSRNRLSSGTNTENLYRQIFLAAADMLFLPSSIEFRDHVAIFQVIAKSRHYRIRAIPSS